MLSTKLKWIKTIVIYILVFLISFCLRSFFSTLLDFTEILNSTIEIVSFGLSVRCIGGCVGALLAIILFKHWDRLTVVAMFLMLGAIASAIIPNVTCLIFYYCLKFVIGLTGGLMRAAVVVTLTEIWDKNVTPFLQTYALIQTVSGFVTPLMLHPFLSDALRTSPNITDTNLTFHQKHNLSVLIDFSHDISKDIKSEIWIPYASLGFVMSIAAFIALCLQLWIAKTSKRWNIDHSILENNNVVYNDNEDGVINRTTYWSIALIFIALIFLMAAKNIAFLQFWTTFVVYSDLEFSKAKGNLMLSAFALAMGTGSFVNIFISLKLKPMKMLLILVTLMLSGNVIVLFFGESSETLLWIGGILIGFGSGPAVATILSCLHAKIKMTNLTSSLASMSNNLLHACGLPVLIGYYIQQCPYILIYFNLLILFIAIMLLISLQFVGNNHKSIMHK